MPNDRFYFHKSKQNPPKAELLEYGLTELPALNIDHCFDFLRQAIMCHGDVTMTYWCVVLSILLLILSCPDQANQVEQELHRLGRGWAGAALGLVREPHPRRARNQQQRLLGRRALVPHVRAYRRVGQTPLRPTQRGLLSHRRLTHVRDAIV